MHPDKSLSTNELNQAFYQKFWDLLSDDIFNASCSWLENAAFLAGINATKITLIPKCDNFENMCDLHPYLYLMLSIKSSPSC